MDKKHLRRNVFKVLKKCKIIFNTHQWLTGFKDIRVQKALHPEGSQKSPRQIKREKQLVRQYWHCGTFHYERYGLAYLNLSETELLDFVPTYYHHKVLEKAHAGIDTVYYGDKLNQARLFSNCNIPSANTLAVYENGLWYELNKKSLVDINHLIENYLCNGENKLFIKPRGGSGGFGILVLKKVDGCYVLNRKRLDGLQMLNDELGHCQFIMQEGVSQSKQMMEINSSCVNTLRVVVQQEAGKMVMKTCIIRMGRQGKDVDNSAQGGISVKVDIISGQVAATATAEHGGGVMICHPDSGKAFGDISINNWQTLKEEIETIATKLIDFKNIALDIAVTDKGAKLLEFNFRYGIEHQQCVLGGVRRILDIYP